MYLIGGDCCSVFISLNTEVLGGGWGFGGVVGRWEGCCAWGDTLENWRIMSHQNTEPTATKSSPLWLEFDGGTRRSFMKFFSVFYFAGYRPPASVSQNAAGEHCRDVQSESSERDTSGAADKSSLLIRQIDIYLHLAPQMSCSQSCFFFMFGREYHMLRQDSGSIHQTTVRFG